MEIAIPNDWRPRDYQRKAWQAWIHDDVSRVINVWHRRAGKDSFAINGTAVKLHQRVGNYWHMFPEYTQGRKAIWTAIDRQGRRIIDQAFPKATRRRTNDQEMMIEFLNGSTWQVVGSDKFNKNVGSNPAGIVFSEYSISKPAAWDYLSPILAENDGWALFIYTPRGENHGHDLFNFAQGRENWYTQILTADDTGAISQDALQDERDRLLPEIFEQEYYCSFQGAVVGSFYAKQIVAAQDEGRITSVPYEPDLPVYTAWDMGIDDCTSIWFFQIARGEIRIIDFYENSSEGLPHYAEVCKAKPYKYECDFVPHDAKVREFGSGKTRVETMIGLGLKPRLVPNHYVIDGINAVRQVMPMCWFDERKTMQGIKALKHYQREWDDTHKKFSTRPLHDWTSHAADAFRYMAMAHKDVAAPKPEKEIRTIQNITMNDLWDLNKHARSSGSRI